MEEPAAVLPETIVCPACDEYLDLLPIERIRKRLACPACGAELDFNGPGDDEAQAASAPGLTRMTDRELYEVLVRPESYTLPHLRRVVRELEARELDTAFVPCPAGLHAVPDYGRPCPFCAEREREAGRALERELEALLPEASDLPALPGDDLPKEEPLLAQVFGRKRTFDVFRHEEWGQEDVSWSHVAVKRGFSWPALCFGVYWALVKGFWGYAGLLAVVVVAERALDLLARTDPSSSWRPWWLAAFLAFWGLTLRMALRGNAWRIPKLEREGYRCVGTVEAFTVREAIARFAASE